MNYSFNNDFLKNDSFKNDSLKDDFILMILSCKKYETERRVGQIKQFLQNNNIMNGMRYFHIVGDTTNMNSDELEKGYKIDETNNIIYTNTKDDYLSLPHKTIMGFKALLDNYSFKYIYKSDDDQRVIVPTLFIDISKALLLNKPDYAGNMYILPRKIETYQPRVHAADGFPSNYIVGDGKPFTNGRLYALSRRNIEDLTSNEKFDLIKKELSEDWAIAKYQKDEYRMNNLTFRSLQLMMDYDKYNDLYNRFIK